MKTILAAALLSFSISATALSISTPVLDVKATTEACPSVMNGWVVYTDWLKAIWGNPWVFTN